ncbi:coiled-coil domain-containing protein 180-like isoform X5 [Taeniopygia guttata]|uniref:coiled-coil domain-containing protein 180-like isoform X5 n=1 Tax=Taeniopygia guttata TaxID=59729 RepID=UPI003BB985F4
MFTERKAVNRSSRPRHSEMFADAMPFLMSNQQKCVGTTPISDFTKKPQSDRQSTTFPEAWGNVGASSAEEVRGLPDVVATVPGYRILISSLAVPEETGSSTWKNLAERRQKHHDRAVMGMQRELGCIGRGLEELWNMIHEESSNRRKCIRAMDASLKETERSRAMKITEVLTKYTVKLEEISFFLAADVHKLINNKAMNINRALLGNERASAKLLFNLTKSELEKEKLHQLKWQERVKDWKLIQKNCVIQSFRVFMASEEVQNPPAEEMENMIKEQIVLVNRD